MVLDAHKLGEATSDHQTTIQKVANKLIEQLALLQEVIEMKTNVVIAHGILKIGHESLFHGKQSLEFFIENSMRFVNELKDVHDLVQKIIDKLFQYLKILYIENLVSTNGKLVEIKRMKSKWLAFVDEVIDLVNF